jgi:ferric enterobactin receptor
VRSDDSQYEFQMRAGAWLAIPLALLLAVDAAAQCRVEGIVRGSDGAPVGGATVRMRGPDLPSPLITTSDADGRWAFEKVKPGIRVEIVALESGRTLARSFALVTLFVETVDLVQTPEPLTGGPADLDPQGGPSAGIRGVVRSADGAPVEGARVTISNTTVMTTTDSGGRYAFGRLRSGLALELGASANGFKPASSEVTVPGSADAQADFVLEADRADAATNRSLVDSVREGRSLAVQPDFVTGVPSVAPRDVFRALQFLPEASGSLETVSGLNVRGGTADQTLVRFDGFTVYPFSTVFGGLSALNADAIGRADFSAGTFDAADGGRLAGVLKLTGEANATGKPTASVTASLFGVATRVSAPIGDRASFLVAARHSPPQSIYDRVLDRVSTGNGQPVHDRVARFSGGLFAATPQSSFDDVNGKLDLKLTPTDHLSASIYDGHEAANKSRNLALPSHSDLAISTALSVPEDADAQISDIETWKGRGFSATWERRWSPAASSTLSIGHSEFSKTSDTSSVLASGTTGQDYSFAEGRGGSGGLAESNHIADTTVRLASSIALGFAHVVGVGGEVTSLETDYAARTEVVQRTADAGDFTSNLVPLLDRAGTGRTATMFAQDAWRPIADLTIAPGVRLSHYGLAASTYVEPRVSARYLLFRRLRLTGAWGIDHQSVIRIAREDLMHGDGEFWALADGSTIPIARAQQMEVGVGVTGPDVVWDTRVYVKALDDLTLFAPRLFPGSTVNQSGSTLYRGSGRAAGVETLVRYRSGWNTGWTSYTFSRTEYTYPTLEAATFPGDFDQQHELKVADVARLRGWSLGAAWVLGSGRPFTPASGTQQIWFPSGDPVYQITFGPKNSDRLAPYHRLDVSARRDARFRVVTLGLGATLFNVYDRQNIAYRDYEIAGASFAASDAVLMRRTLNVLLTIGF